MRKIPKAKLNLEPWEPWLVFFILILGFSLRITGINFGLSMNGNWNPDEIVRKTEVLLPSLNPQWFGYGSLDIYLLFTVDLLHFSLVKLLGLPGHILAYHDYLQSVIPLRYLIGRFITVCMGTANIAFLFFIARRLTGSGTASLICALIFALLPIHVMESHYATVDVPLTFFCTLTLFFSLTLRKSSRISKFMLAGFFAGLTCSIKYTGFFTIIIYLSACFSLFLKKMKRDGFKNSSRLVFFTLVGLISACAGFFITSPYVFIDHDAFNRDFSFEIQNKIVQKQNALNLLSGLNDYRSILEDSHGEALLFLALCGVMILFFQKGSFALPAVLFPVIYLLSFSSVPTILPRYILPVFPFTSLISAYFLGWMLSFSRGSSRIARIFINTAGLVFFFWTIGFEIFQTAKVEKLFLTEDTRYKALRWIEQNIPQSSKILVYSNGQYSPTIPETKYKVINTLDYKEMADTNFDGFKPEIADYVVHSSFGDGDRLIDWLLNEKKCLKLLAHIKPQNHELTFHFHNPEIFIYQVVNF